jgi:hypothetical protein
MRRDDKARPQAPLPAPLLGCLPEDALTEPGWLLLFLSEDRVKNKKSENQENVLALPKRTRPRTYRFEDISPVEQ